VVVILFSLIMSWIVVLLMRQRLRQVCLDIPNERSSHKIPTPRGGGLGFVVAFLLSTAILTADQHWQWSFFSAFFTLTPHTFIGLINCLIPLAIVGFLDDRHNLPASLRYAVQLGVSLIAVFYISEQPWEPLGLVGSAIALILTPIAMTAFINFYNFMDGLDGLVASVTAVQLGFLAIYLNQPVWWLMVAALVGFLYWNWSPAKIFMGDVGSTVLGASVAIAILNSPTALSQTFAALFVVTPLLGDALYTLICRALRRENIFKAHRTHIYQRLQQSGWSHAQVASTYLLMTLASAIAIYTLGFVGSILTVVGSAIGLVTTEVYLRSQRIQNTAKTLVE
jgi:UDP-N-acetylmuramyl pentapeptide phosphotransferase/UDP-N-acetylglucosamine-1-phosphate transferase